MPQKVHAAITCIHLNIPPNIRLIVITVSELIHPKDMWRSSWEMSDQWYKTTQTELFRK